MLVSLAPEMWGVDHEITAPGNVIMPLRMTVVRLPEGRLVLHSPVPITDAVAAELATLGEVAFVIAPCLLHHLHAGPCLARYPSARFLAPEGLAAKRADLPRPVVLGAEPIEGLAGVLDHVVIDGCPRLREVDFFHRPTGTLVASDLVFNIRDPRTWGTALVTRLFGTYRRLGVSRLYRLYSRDRAATKASLAHVLAWPITRIVPGHGDVFEAPDAAARLREELERAFGPVGAPAWGRRA